MDGPPLSNSRKQCSNNCPASNECQEVFQFVMMRCSLKAARNFSKMFQLPRCDNDVTRIFDIDAMTLFHLSCKDVFLTKEMQQFSDECGTRLC